MLRNFIPTSDDWRNIAITLIFGWGTYLQPHFGHLVGGAFAVLLLIVNLRTFVSSDS
jgi:hypothetical protein